MVRSPPGRRSDDEEPDEEEDEDDEEEEEEPAPRRRARTPSGRGRRRPHPPPVRRWRASEEGEEEDEEEEDERPSRRRRPPPSGKKTVFWRARDSLYFEPLVALAIIIVLLVALFAYTQNWPPMYVVESNSMQHGPNDQLGLINTGDLVLAQKVPLSSITPYVTGLQTGYSTYGEFGDVLLYWPNGGGSTPIIHRALLYLDWDPPGGFYNATDLSALPCGSALDAVFAYFAPGAESTPTCDTTHLALGGVLDLYRIGWMSENISVDLTSNLGDHSGFLTMGDANLFPDQTAPIPISTLVEPGWIIGVARGMLPWFGALKLLLEGQTADVPTQSWQYMGLTIAAVILLAYGIHYALRTEGVETPLRREEEQEARAAAEAAAVEPGSGPRGWLSRRRHRPSEEEEEEETEAKSARRHRTRPPPSSSSVRRGRPVPRVRRSDKPAKKRESDEEL